jgi:DNA-binding transcriptional ArsR family regulator
MTGRDPAPYAQAPYAYDGLDRVLHERARLSLLTSLAAHPRPLAFTDLKQLCGLTDGNLSRHLAVLEEAGLVEIRKGYEGRRPLTTCRLTPAGSASSTTSRCWSAWSATPPRRRGKDRTRAGARTIPFSPELPLFYPETLRCKVLLQRK